MPLLWVGIRIAFLTAAAAALLFARGLADPARPDMTRGPLTPTGFWELFHSSLGRESHAAVYDPVRDRILAFSGLESGFGQPLADDVLVYSPTGSPVVSRLVTSGPAPPGRVGHTAIYDPLHDRVVVFGGGTGTTYGSFGGTKVNDVWTLSLNGTPTWTQLSPAGTPPSPRGFHTAVYDPLRQRMVVYGGYSTNFNNDTWALSLDDDPTWTQLHPGGPSPPVWVAGHSAIYVPGQDRMLVYGGLSGGVPYSFVFSLSLGSLSWTELSPGGVRPSGRFGHRAVYDEWYGSMVMFGGTDGSILNNEVWVLSLGSSPAWSFASPAGARPRARSNAAMVYDPSRRRSVICGGFNLGVLADQWALRSQGSEWIELAQGAASPPPRVGHTVVYDASDDRLVMFGGIEMNDVWALSLGMSPAWSRVDPTGPPPPPRAEHTAVFDPVRRRIIVFGGRSSSTPGLGDLWELALDGSPRWSPLAATGGPPAVRYGHSAIYDPLRDRMIVSGGFGPLGYVRDIWALSLNGPPVWTPVVPAHTPSAVSVRYGHTAIYDPPRDRMVVFGGADGYGAGESWALSLNAAPAWSLLAAAGGPEERSYHVAVHDAARDRMVIYGGAYRHDTWALSLDATPTWTQIGSEPAPSVSSTAAIHDPIRDRMIVTYGREDSGFFPTSTWCLRWDDPVPTLVSLADVEVASDRIVVMWYGSDLAGRAGRVARRGPESDWEQLGTAVADGTGRFRWEDLTVRAGGRYAYRMSIDLGSGEAQSETGWLHVPERNLSLMGFHPNPARGVPAVALALAESGSATLALFDLAGRKILERDVGGLGPGTHLVSLGADARIAPGVYTLRLTHSGRVLSARGVVLQ